MNIDTSTVKKTLNLCAQMGAGAVAFSIVRNNVTVDAQPIKAMAYIGTFALASKAAKVAGSSMDEIVENLSGLINSSSQNVIYFQ